MPADLVVNAILAAAAAVAAGAAGAIAASSRQCAGSGGQPPGGGGGSGSNGTGGLPSSGTVQGGAGGADQHGDSSRGSDSAGRPPALLVVQSSSSSTYPMTLMEGWNAALEFIAAHPPKFRLSWGLPGAMDASFQPDSAAVKRERRWTALKVRLACLLLRWASCQGGGVWTAAGTKGP